jgi:pyruvate formate lyase activating enzyme
VEAMERRDFLIKFSTCCAGFIVIPSAINKSLAKSPAEDEPYIREARYYNTLDNNLVECTLCPNRCIVRGGRRGLCDVRENQDGVYKTLVYGRLCSMNIDPIEKKPLFHFLPGTNALSVATAGCNVECKFCQNWNISQAKPEELTFRYVSPHELVNLAKYYNTPTIAFTYSEPTIFYEYMYDTAVFANENSIRGVMISNGFMNREPMIELCKVLNAIKIDFKSYSEKFYREIVSGELKPVLDSLVLVKERGRFLEIVYLVIPTLNDDKNELRDMCKWIINNLGQDVPLHFTRFHPQYLLKNLPPTPVGTLEMAYDIAKDAGINYVYIGNVPGHKAENTVCPNCGKVLIERTGYFVKNINIKNGKCRFCDLEIPGVWS